MLLSFSMSYGKKFKIRSDGMRVMDAIGRFVLYVLGALTLLRFALIGLMWLLSRLK